MGFETPNYIKSLLVHNGKAPQGRKVWSIDLQSTWLPFFTATNTVGDTHIAHDALGCPLLLGYDKDGTVKFSKSGRPVMRVVKELSDSIRMVRENFVAGLVSYAGQVAIDNPDEYGLQGEMAREAGLPIATKDSEAVIQAQAIALERSIATATATAKVTAKRRSKERSNSEGDTEAIAGAVA